MVAHRTFDEIVDFITSAPSPAQILAFKPSAAMQSRVNELLEKKREGSLTEPEAREVEQFLMLEHLMRLAKAKARQRLAA